MQMTLLMAERDLKRKVEARISSTTRHSVPLMEIETVKQCADFIGLQNTQMVTAVVPTLLVLRYISEQRHFFTTSSAMWSWMRDSF